MRVLRGLTLGLALVLSSCTTAASESAPTPSASTTTNNAKTTPTSASASKTATESISVTNASGSSYALALVGTWATSCTPTNVSSGSGYTVWTTTFSSGGTVAQKVQVFFDAACTSPPYNNNTSGTYQAGGQQINETMTTFSMTPEVASVATQFNNEASCGHTTWAAGTPLDATACNATSYPTFYDTFEIDGNSLYFATPTGTNDTGTTEQQRATVINKNVAYQRQAS